MFVNGIVGIGKTETVKQYLKKYSGKYNNILWVSFKNSLEEMLTDDISVSVVGLNRIHEESDTEYCMRKLERMRALLIGINILVIDNMNSMEFIEN